MLSVLTKVVSLFTHCGIVVHCHSLRRSVHETKIQLGSSGKKGKCTAFGCSIIFGYGAIARLMARE